MKTRLRIALLGLFLGLAPSSYAHAEAGRNPLSVEVRLTSTPTEPKLTFTVKNISNETVTLAQPNLPWGNRYSVVIVAADRKSGSPLKGTYPIDDDFLPPKVSIKPGESLSGEIDLAFYVPDVGKKSRTHDLILFWYYDAHGDQAPLGEYGGWIVVPKSTR